MSDELTSALVSLLVVALVAALAPFIVALVPRLRVPQIVVLIVGGIILQSGIMLRKMRPLWLEPVCSRCWSFRQSPLA